MATVEIRLHGRGGQGAVSAAEMLVAAFAMEGKHTAGFPFFGSERRGAPTTAFVRFGDRPIREKTKIYAPDCLIVFDPSQLKSPAIFSGLNPGGIIVTNSNNTSTDRPRHDIRILGIIDATPIALEKLGLPAISTCMIGALAAATKWLKIESILSVLPDYFKGHLLEKNMACVTAAYEKTAVFKFNDSPNRE